MKISQILIKKLFFNPIKANAAQEIKIIYSIFSRTIKVNSLKTFAEEGVSTKKLRRILKATGSTDKEIRTLLNKNFEKFKSLPSKFN